MKNEARAMIELVSPNSESACNLAAKPSNLFSTCSVPSQTHIISYSIKKGHSQNRECPKNTNLYSLAPCVGISQQVLHVGLFTNHDLRFTLVSMDKFFGNIENHYGEVKKKLDEYIAKRSEEDAYFKDRTAEDFRECQRRVERSVEYFVALAAYFVEVNAFLLEFATAAVAAGEAKK
jgi:hypothetical protein